MIEIILLCLFTSMVCCGLFFASREGLILHKIRKILENKPSIIADPLLLCPFCMSSVWSIITHGLLGIAGVIEFNIIVLILSIPATCFINFIMTELFDNLLR